MAQTTEKAFETYVTQMLLAKEWQQGSVSEWDKEQALFLKYWITCWLQKANRRRKSDLP